MAGMKERLTLVKVSRTGDAYQTEARQQREVYAEKLPNYANEFKTANACGFELMHVMRVRVCEYGGEKEALYKGQAYDVYRTFQNKDDWLELYLSTKGKNGGA